MNILVLGDSLLRQKSLPVSEVTDEIRALLQKMSAALKKADGVGLAAVQVGTPLRIFITHADDDVVRVFINPQIIATSTEIIGYEEGCLSIPKVYEEIVRPKRITVQALNERGRPFTLEATGLLARVIQHENDHLDGILFLDRGAADFKEKTEEAFARKATDAAIQAQE